MRRYHVFVCSHGLLITLLRFTSVALLINLMNYDSPVCSITSFLVRVTLAIIWIIVICWLRQDRNEMGGCHLNSCSCQLLQMILLLKNSKPLIMLPKALSTLIANLRKIMSIPFKTLPNILPNPSRPFPKISFENSIENLPIINSKFTKNHDKFFQNLLKILSQSTQNSVQTLPWRAPGRHINLIF